LRQVLARPAIGELIRPHQVGRLKQLKSIAVSLQ
jgi:hypothetical protein